MFILDTKEYNSHKSELNYEPFEPSITFQTAALGSQRNTVYSNTTELFAKKDYFDIIIRVPKPALPSFGPLPRRALAAPRAGIVHPHFSFTHADDAIGGEGASPSGEVCIWRTRKWYFSHTKCTNEDYNHDWLY